VACADECFNVIKHLHWIYFIFKSLFRYRGKDAA
jgi:hypothetical protein